MSMCWCKDCKWYQEEHFEAGICDYHTAPVGAYESCKYSEIKADAITEEYGKGFGDGYREAMDSK